jgi:benzoate membrane transport protein
MPIDQSAPAPAAASAPAFWRDLSATHVADGLVGFLFAASGPLAIILASGTRGGLSEAQIASWVFGSLFANGILSVGFSLAWRQPLAFFWTIPGTVLIGPALGHLSFAEVIGAYIVTGLLMVALGSLGLVRRAMASVPMPIVMGMVAGVFLQFGLDWVRAFQADVWIAAAMTAVFLVLSAAPSFARRLPPILAALVAGVAVMLARGGLSGGAGDLGAGTLLSMLAAPQWQLPQFSWAAIAELVVPLAITVLVVQNGQGVAILTAAGHRPPVDAIAVGCGVASVLSAFVGAVSTCLTGPVNAIISGGGERRTQYTAGVTVGVLAMLFGLFAPLVTRLMLSTPSAFIATLAGLAMLKVLQGAFVTAFQTRYTLGALVTVAGIPIFNIGAPFWALIAGTAVSLVLERGDWGDIGGGV